MTGNPESYLMASFSTTMQLCTLISEIVLAELYILGEMTEC